MRPMATPGKEKPNRTLVISEKALYVILGIVIYLLYEFDVIGKF